MRATEKAGAEGYNDPGAYGLWGTHEGAHGLQKGRWCLTAMTLKNQNVRPEDLFFGDHLILTAKYVRISAKTFFWRSHHNLDKTATLSPFVLEFTKPEIRHI